MPDRFSDTLRRIDGWWQLVNRARVALWSGCGSNLHLAYRDWGSAKLVEEGMLGEGRFQYKVSCLKCGKEGIEEAWELI